MSTKARWSADDKAEVETPFLNEELFSGVSVEKWDPRAAQLAEESPFLQTDLERIEQEVIGTDERTLVTDTLKIPYRWICAIDILIDNPRWGKSTSEPQFISKSRGTGVLIGPRYVLTAKHISDKQTVEIEGEKRSVDVQGFTVSPARNGDNSKNPFGKVKSKEIHVSQPYQIRRKVTQGGRVIDIPIRQQDDYALIILEKDLDSSTHSKMTGVLGYWGNTSAAEVRALNLDRLKDKDIVVAGYPGDACGKEKFSGSASSKERKIANCWNRRNDEWASTQWKAAGRLQVQENSNTVFHTADTYEGQSGGPICLTVDKKMVLVGIHTGQEDATRNKGVRVTSRMLTEIRDWMNADAGYTIATITDDRLVVQPQTAPTAGAKETEDYFVEAEEETEESLYEFDTPTPSQAITDALDKQDWTGALRLAIQEGWHDENDLTNLVFFARHKELPAARLDPDAPNFKQLSQEWTRIRDSEVRPAIRTASEDADLKVSGKYVAERDPQFAGERGKKFKDLVESVAKEVDLNPGFLAAVLLAEWDQNSLYLGSAEVRSFQSGADDFYAQRAQLSANVPAFSKVRFDESRKTTNINEHGRRVTTIPFTSGKDAALATAVYLKYCEIKVRKGLEKNGGDFDRLPVATRFALVRIAMAAGHGGIDPDGELVRFKPKGKEWVRVKAGEKGGVLFGVASRLERVLKGEDILVRKNEPRKDPSESGHVTNRNATILAAQAMHLADWVFGVPVTVPAAPQPELETLEGFDIEFDEESQEEFQGVSNDSVFPQTSFENAADELEELGEFAEEESDQAILTEAIAELLPERFIQSEIGPAPFSYETPPLPSGLYALEHWSQPMKRDRTTNSWIPDGGEQRLEPLDPGFLTADDELKTAGFHAALKDLLIGNPDFSRHLSRDAVRDGAAKPGDKIRVALVDLTGSKLLDPEFAGWGSTVPVDGASCAKIAALYAAFQLRNDLKHVAAAENITKTAELVRVMNERWKKERIDGPPNLEKFLYRLTNPPDLEFTAEVDGAVDNLIDAHHANHAARILIEAVGFPYIASLMWQSGLRHPRRGGLWLTSNYEYEGGGPWSRPVRPAPLPVFGHNATALSLATFFTLLAQDRLARSGLPRTIKTALSTASWFRPVLPDASIASKVGLLMRCLERGPKMKDGKAVLGKDGKPVMECKRSEATHVHEAGLIENGGFRYAVAIMTTGIPTGVTLLKTLIVELDRLIRANNP